jgi:hypothetical protein
MNRLNVIPRLIVVAAFLVMLFSAATVTAHPPSSQESTKIEHPPARSLSAIQVDVHAALRSEAATRRLGDNASQVVRLIDLYREMAAHPKRHSSLFLRRLGLQLRARLENVRDHMERQDSLPERGANATKVRLPALAAPKARVLAQQMGVPGGPVAGQAVQPAATAIRDAATIDYGPELVDLIQQTISPATWDINGGNGTVAYFAPRRAIVVSAPERVHDKIDDVLGQLRSAP